jgi:ATP-binding cassette subfamily B protein
MIVGPKILGKATTKLFEGVMAQLAGTGSGIDFVYIGNILLLTLGLYLTSTLFSYIQGWIMSGIAMDISYRFRRDISTKINRMPLKYFDGTNYGEVLSRITNDVDTVSQTLGQTLTQVITSLTTLIGVLIMMLSISWQMTLVALLIVPVSLLIIGLIISQSQRYFKQQQDYLGHVNGHVEEMYGGHVVMKAFNGEEDSIRKFVGFNDTLYDSAWKSQFLSGLMMPIMNFVSNVAYVVVSILGGWLAINNAITVGDIQAFIQYVRSFTQPLTQIANISNIFQQTAACRACLSSWMGWEIFVEEPVILGSTGSGGMLCLVGYMRIHRDPQLLSQRSAGHGLLSWARLARQDHNGQAADAFLRCESRRDLD